MKLRASWGQNGNAAIAPFQYQTTFAFDASNGYYFDSGKKVQTVGGYADILANPDVTWETLLNSLTLALIHGSLILV